MEKQTDHGLQDTKKHSLHVQYGHPLFFRLGSNGISLYWVSRSDYLKKKKAKKTNKKSRNRMTLQANNSHIWINKMHNIL